MFEYTVNTTADNKKFLEVCHKIENGVKPTLVSKPLVDVDGSVIQEYILSENKIVIYNDYDVDAIYIISDVDISAIL